MYHQDWKQVVWRKDHTDNSNVGTHRTQEQKEFHRLASDDFYTDVDKPSTHFKTRLRQGRIAKGMSQSQLALRCNISTSSVKAYENGTQTPSVGQRIILNRVLMIRLPKC